MMCVYLVVTLVFASKPTDAIMCLPLWGRGLNWEAFVLIQYVNEMQQPSKHCAQSHNSGRKRPGTAARRKAQCSCNCISII